LALNVFLSYLKDMTQRDTIPGEGKPIVITNLIGAKKAVLEYLNQAINQFGIYRLNFINV